MPLQTTIESAETVVLGLAFLSSGLGHWVVSVSAGTRYTRRVLAANCVMSGFTAAGAGFAVIHGTPIQVGVHLAVIGGFFIGAIWGPLGLWRFAALLLQRAGTLGTQLGPVPPAPPQLTPTTPPVTPPAADTPPTGGQS